jgi:hypothetical protein
MPGPITPDEVQTKKEIPEEVFEIFNRLIQENWDGVCAIVLQDEAADMVASRLQVPRSRIFEEHWFDIEGHYEAVGWRVDYDKPGYNESYAETFKFRKKEKKR